MKKTLFLMLLCAIPIQAEEAVRVQATPQVQAVNLAPIETPATGSPQNIIELKAQPQQVVRVQATPVVPQNLPAEKPVQQVTAPANAQTPTVYKPPVQLVQPQNKPVSNLTTPAAVNIEACSRMFGVNAENLFVLTLGAIEANNFEIQELQSHNGYITFKAMGKEFLATIAEVDNKNAMVRINPTNGVYHFAPGIVAKIFEYIAYKLAK